MALLVLLVYAALNLGVNVDTMRVLHPEIPSNVRLEAFSKLFPVLNEAIVVVLDARTPEQARDAVRQSGVFVHNAINHAHWQQRLTSPNDDERAKGRANIEHCIRVSHAAGGSGVLSRNLAPGAARSSRRARNTFIAFDLFLCCDFSS